MSSNDQISTGHTRFGRANFAFSWCIEDYNVAQGHCSTGQSVASPRFQWDRFPEKIYQLELFPRGRQPKLKNWVGLRIVDCGMPDPAAERDTHFTVSIRDDPQAQGYHHSKMYSKRFDAVPIDDGVFIAQNVLESLLRNRPELTRTFWLVCEVSVCFTESRLRRADSSVASTLQGHLRLESLRDPQFCDVTLMCQRSGWSLVAHRVILAAASPVFKERLCRSEGCGGGDRHHHVEIVDMSPKALELMLRFIYTGDLRPRSGQQRKNSADVQVTIELLCQLLEAAEKFQMPNLKRLCEDRLTGQLNWENYDMLYRTAKRCKARELARRLERFAERGAHSAASPIGRYY